MGSTIPDIRKIVREGYDKIDYQKHFRQNRELTTFEAKLLGLLYKNVPESARILDLGAGPGVPYDSYIVSRGHTLIGVDNCHKAIDQARVNVPSAQYIQWDMLLSLTSFEDQSFDGVVSFYAIFHLPREEHGELFEEMWRVLRPGGVILVTLGTSDSEYGEESDWCGARMAWSSHSPDVYERMIGEAGFVLLQTEFEGEPGDEEYHLWVLAKKASHENRTQGVVLRNGVLGDPQPHPAANTPTPQIGPSAYPRLRVLGSLTHTQRGHSRNMRRAIPRLTAWPTYANFL